MDGYMKCPYCGFDNIAGSDTCDNCQEDLSSRDGISASKGKIEKVLMSDPISKIPPHEATCVGADASVLDAVKKMNQCQSGCVVVTNGEDYRSFQNKNQGSDDRKCGNARRG